MLTPQRRAQMDAVLGKSGTTTTLTPERRAQMDAVLGKNQPSASGFVGNVISSAFNNAKDIGSAIVNTVNPNMEKNTIMNMSKLAQGAGQLLDPTRGNKLVQASNKVTSHILPFMRPFLNPKNENLEQMPKNVGKFYADRYGSLDKIKQTAYNDPVGVGLDVATVATGVGGLAKGGATAAARAGQMGVASNLAKTGSALTKVGTMADPFMMGAKVAAKPFSMMSRPLGKVGSRLSSESILTRGLGNPQRQAKMAQRGTPAPELMKKYNLYDRMPESAGEAVRQVGSTYDDLALNSGRQVQAGAMVKAFNDEIAKLEAGVGGVVSDANKAKIAELIRRRDQLLKAGGGMTDANGQLIASPREIGADTLTRFRREVIDPDIPQSTFNLDARSSGTAQGAKKSRDIIKTQIDQTHPKIAELGLDYGGLKELEKIFEAYQQRVNNRQVFNIHKLGGAGLGGYFGGITGAIGGFMLEQFVNSPEFLKFASKVADKTNKIRPSKVRFSNRSKVKPSNVYSFGKYGRLFSDRSGVDKDINQP